MPVKYASKTNQIIVIQKAKPINDFALILYSNFQRLINKMFAIYTIPYK